MTLGKKPEAVSPLGKKKKKDQHLIEKEFVSEGLQLAPIWREKGNGGRSVKGQTRGGKRGTLRDDLGARCIGGVVGGLGWFRGLNDGKLLVDLV